MKKAKKQKNNSWDNLSGFRYAHRGLFSEPMSASLPPAPPSHEPRWQKDIDKWKRDGRPIVPENTIEAFKLAVKHGYGSELDVHLTKDGSLPVFHDDSLLRMCAENGLICDMTREELDGCRLLGTDSRIPELAEILDLYTSKAAQTDRKDNRNMGRIIAGETDRNTATAGISGVYLHAGPGVNEKEAGSDIRTTEADRVKYLHLPLIIELKADSNVKQLCPAVMEVVDRYPELNYCIESFDPRVIYWFRKNRPEVIRGQLTENFCRSRAAVKKWGYILTFGMWCGAPDVMSRPDFISSRFRDRKNIFMRLRHRLGTRQVNWTIKNKDEMKAVDREGGIGIFERFLPDKKSGRSVHLR